MSAKGPDQIFGIPILGTLPKVPGKVALEGRFGPILVNLSPEGVFGIWWVWASRVFARVGEISQLVALGFESLVQNLREAVPADTRFLRGLLSHCV